ncbi:hypothetical protein DB41_GK00140 [Neochlamydia sp. TUME1]|nr:hypothetical protein DB41_GK00140 [Neochlamydia sp. TUME1]
MINKAFLNTKHSHQQRTEFFFKAQSKYSQEQGYYLLYQSF